MGHHNGKDNHHHNGKDKHMDKEAIEKKMEADPKYKALLEKQKALGEKRKNWANLSEEDQTQLKLEFGKVQKEMEKIKVYYFGGGEDKHHHNGKDKHHHNGKDKHVDKEAIEKKMESDPKYKDLLEKQK